MNIEDVTAGDVEEFGLWYMMLGFDVDYEMAQQLIADYYNVGINQKRWTCVERISLRVI